MSSRSNQLLTGIIVLLLGLILLLQGYINVNVGSVLFIICGGAFIVSYKTKRRTWALILGVYLLYLGLTDMVGRFVPGLNIWNITGAMFFLVPGVIFFIMFFEKGRRGLLFPASFMVWFGLFTVAKNMKLIDINNFALFIAFLGFAFYTIHYFGKGFMSGWAFRTGTVFMVLAVIFSGYIGKFIGVLGGLVPILAVFLIILSFAIIIKALTSHKE